MTETIIKSKHIGNSRIRDLTGNQYLHFKVLSYAGFNSRSKANWVCECECGNKFIASSTEINEELIISCGCIKKEGKSADQKLLDDIDSRRITVLQRAKPNKNNKSGHRGVCKYEDGTWYAKLVFHGVTYRVRCDNELQAIYERKKLEMKYIEPFLKENKKLINKRNKKEKK